MGQLRKIWNGLVAGIKRSVNVEPPAEASTDPNYKVVATRQVAGYTITFHEPVANPNAPPSKVAVLLKEATAAKEAGDLDTAINILRSAYKEIADGGIAYSVETFLKLPLYLQRAGRNDEAWREFNLLITHGYPNQIGGVVLPMDHSQIYDKMRLFLQREKKFDLAVRFGVWSYVCWGIGLYRQERKSEFEEYFNKGAIESVLTPLLKKAKKLHLLDQLVEIISTETNQVSNQVSKIGLADLGRKIDEIVMV